MKARLAAVGSLVFIFFAGLAAAAEVPFSQIQFDAARESGRPIAVVFHADWCPTCRAQAPLLKDLSQKPEYSRLTVYIANYDQERDLKKSLGVTRQSTVVVFKQSREVGRSTGDTSEGSLAALLHLAIS